MAFPTTTGIDTFSRPNENPIGAPWAGPLYTGEVQLVISSDTLKCNTTGANSYYNRVYGADCEVWALIAAREDGEEMNIFARIINPNNASMCAYRLDFNPQAGATDILLIRRVDNQLSTTLGANILQEVATGDSIGLECIGNQISAYYKAAAGAWTLLATRTDSTYSAGGYLGAEMSHTVMAIDTFGGGTIASAAPPPITFPMSGISR